MAEEIGFTPAHTQTHESRTMELRIREGSCPETRRLQQLWTITELHWSGKQVGQGYQARTERQEWRDVPIFDGYLEDDDA